jgi:hypothetical protein
MKDQKDDNNNNNNIHDNNDDNQNDDDENENDEDDSFNELNTDYTKDNTDNNCSIDDTAQDTNQQQQQQNSFQKGPYVGYAIIMLRDDEECNIIINELNNRIITFDSVYTTKEEIQHNIDFYNIVHNSNSNEINNDNNNGTTFRIKVRPVDHHHTIPKGLLNHTTNKNKNSETDNMAFVPTIQEHQEHTISTNIDTPIKPGQDPPLIDILRPLSTEILLDRIQRLGGDISTISSVSASSLLLASSLTIPINSDPSKTMIDILQEQHDHALDCTVQAYTKTPITPKFIYHEGKLIPYSIRDKLLHILQNLRWAVPNHRSGMNTERYLVLLSNVQNDIFYNDLRIACKELMNYINHRDQTYQYAISLGNFNNGGELCIDGGLQLIETDATTVSDHTANTQKKVVPIFHVVNTHNRITRVDGRHVHWVRTWSTTTKTADGTSCDRYSLIFYDTSQRQPTPIIDMTDPNVSVT